MSVYRAKKSAEGWVVKCPAMGHIIIPSDGRWTFNGNYERPSFSPSINETIGSPGSTLDDLRNGKVHARNHVVITDGVLHYCGDCTHTLAGQSVEIPPLSDAEAVMYFLDGQPRER